MAKPPKREAAPRLDATAWIVAALNVLADEGIDGVRVEVLARRLAVTKGSFYWHFKDRKALHSAMLNHWSRRATLDIIERLDRNDRPLERFQALMRLPFMGPKADRGAEVELAVRLWGRRDARVRDAIAEVDLRRTRYIAELLCACGTPAENAYPKAVLAYAYMQFGRAIINPNDQDQMLRCETILLGG